MHKLTEEQEKLLLAALLGPAVKEDLIKLAKSLKASGLSDAEIALTMCRGVRTIQVYLKS